jgi:hypothetical protein
MQLPGRGSGPIFEPWGISLVDQYSPSHRPYDTQTLLSIFRHHRDFARSDGAEAIRESRAEEGKGRETGSVGFEADRRSIKLQ